MNSCGIPTDSTERFAVSPCGFPLKRETFRESLDRLEAKYYLVEHQMYNSKGYKICGYMNQNVVPCQRIGKCPFHSKKPKQTITSYPSNVIKVSSISFIKKKPYRKGWSHEEHIRFLVGLKIYGKGSWKSISRVVKTRTPLQTQSHAQKYFQRQSQRRKKKKSIHDQTLSDVDEKTVSELVQRHKEERLKQNESTTRSRVKKEKRNLSYKSSTPPLETMYSNAYSANGSGYGGSYVSQPYPMLFQPFNENARFFNYTNTNNCYQQQNCYGSPVTYPGIENTQYGMNNGMNNTSSIYVAPPPISNQQCLSTASSSSSTSVSSLPSFSDIQQNTVMKKTIIPSFEDLNRMIFQNSEQSVLVKRKRNMDAFEKSNVLPPMKKLRLL